MIEEIITEISKKIKMSSGDNFLGFQIDCDALIVHEYFLDTSIKINNDPCNMIEITIKINKNILSIQDLSNIIRELYSAVEYSYFSCHGIQWRADCLIFRFVTISTNNEFYVSGTIRISDDKYKKLYEKYREDFKI